MDSLGASCIHTFFLPRSAWIFASSLLACVLLSLRPDLRECCLSLNRLLVKENQHSVISIKYGCNNYSEFQDTNLHLFRCPWPLLTWRATVLL